MSFLLDAKSAVKCCITREKNAGCPLLDLITQLVKDINILYIVDGIVGSAAEGKGSACQLLH